MRKVFCVWSARRLAAIVVAALALGCQGVLPSMADGSDDRLARVLASQELRVGLSAAQPPLNMKNRAGEIVGLEVDLAEALARSMNLRVRFVEVPFADLLDALEREEVDLVISGMTITPERNARVAFAGPYMVSGKSLLTRSEELAGAASLDVLAAPGRRYAALDGSTSYEFVEDVFEQAELVGTVDYAAGVELVRDGKVDALVADYPICALSVVRYPDAGLLTLDTPLTIEPLGVALPADAPLFVNLVENYIKTLDRTGILVQLKAKWFTRGPWVDELP